MGRFLLLGHKVIDLAAVQAMTADDIPSARPRVLLMLGSGIDRIWLVPGDDIEGTRERQADVMRQWLDLVDRWRVAREAGVSGG